MITVIGSLKGGSGKSTVTFNLAVWLAMAGQKVISIDADPQATLTDVVEVRNEEGFEPEVLLAPARVLTDPEFIRQYDEILVDIGTADLETMKLAIRNADRIVIPVPPSQADVWSAQRFLRMIDSVSGGLGPKVLAFINRADTHSAIRETEETAEALTVLPGVKFIKIRVAQRTAFRRSFSEGLAVFEMDPRSKGALEWHALATKLYPNVLK